MFSRPAARTFAAILACSAMLVGCSENSSISAERSTACSTDAGKSLDVQEAWVRVAPEGRAMSAAYLMICNASDQQRSLIAVDAGDLAVAELHETTTSEDGVASMKPVAEFRIDAGETISLKPGGAHVMLIGLSRPITEGESVALTLSFDDGTTMTIDATARNALNAHHH